MRFRPKTKRAIALTAAAVLTATAILPHMYLTPHAAKCKYGNESQHKWTGLKLYWTDIPAATGGNLRWPRKTYFDGGTGIYQGMDNSYCFCVANHTGQAGMGDEGCFSFSMIFSFLAIFHALQWTVLNFPPFSVLLATFHVLKCVSHFP